MHETEEKTLNSLVPFGLIHAIHRWFRGFQGQRVGGPRPCPQCGETTVWRNGYWTNRLFAEGAHNHMENAFDHDATVEELLAVIELVATQDGNTLELGLGVLNDEAAGADAGATTDDVPPEL